MSKEDFFGDIRRSWEFRHTPWTVTTVGLERGTLSIPPRSMLNDLWATLSTVNRYNPEDFSGVPEELRTRLDVAVNRFRSCVESVPSDGPLNEDQDHECSERFDQLCRVVKEVIMRDWIPAVEGLVAEVEGWANLREWPCRRYQKQITERLLETYEVPRLLFQANDIRVELSPLARFVPGALGLASLSIVPSYDSVRLTRTEAGWRLHVDRGKTASSARNLAWNESAFEEAVRWLRQHG